VDFELFAQEGINLVNSRSFAKNLRNYTDLETIYANC